MDFQKARRNMVDCQIHTGGVISAALLEAFQTVPREQFVPEIYQNVSCMDQSVPLGEGRFLLEPLVQGKMIQALDLKPSDVVLDLGGAGYAAALLSALVATVIAVEESPALAERAETIWRAQGLANIVRIDGPFSAGAPHTAPYDAILLNGAIPNIEQNLLDQLANGGRLVAILKKPDDTMGNIVLFTKSGEGTLSSRILGNAAAPYLTGFAPAETFAF